MTGDAARDALRPKYMEVAASVPAEGLGAVAWLCRFAADQPKPMEFLARLYVAADNYAAQNEAMLSAAKQAALDYFGIIAKHKPVLTALAYEPAPDDHKAAATELLNAAGLSRYHAQTEGSA